MYKRSTIQVGKTKKKSAGQPVVWKKGLNIVFRYLYDLRLYNRNNVWQDI
jgi:hypothetical protein